MLVNELLDEFEQKFNYFCPGYQCPDRLKMLGWISADLNELSSKVDDDIFMVFDPKIISTTEGQRAYDLPADFPENFARHAGQRFYQATIWGGDKFACVINDGTKDALLNYESPQQFYSRNLDGETNNRPSIYTITTKSDGSRQLLLSPPPDSNSSTYYSVGGLYKPTDWKLTLESDLPPIPANSAILKYGLMRNVNPQFEPKYAEAFAHLLMTLARKRPVQFVPVLGRSGLNEYTLQRRRI